MIINKKQKTKFAVAFVAACLILFVVAWFDESQPARKEKQDNPPDHQDSEATKKSSALVWGANKDNRQAEQQHSHPTKAVSLQGNDGIPSELSSVIVSDKLKLMPNLMAVMNYFRGAGKDQYSANIEILLSEGILRGAQNNELDVLSLSCRGDLCQVVSKVYSESPNLVWNNVISSLRSGANGTFDEVTSLQQESNGQILMLSYLRKTPGNRDSD